MVYKWYVLSIFTFYFIDSTLKINHNLYNNLIFFCGHTVQCNALSSITNGEDLVSTDGSRTTVTYSCPAGYTLDGEVINYCNSDGTWTSIVPTCGKLYLFCMFLIYLISSIGRASDL